MPRNAPGVMELTPERLAPRQVTREPAREPPTAAQNVVAEKPAAEQLKRGDLGWKQPNRRGKVPISAFVEKQTLYNLKAFLATVSAKKGESVTMQDALIEAIRDYCEKHGFDGDPTKFVQ